MPGFPDLSFLLRQEVSKGPFGLLTSPPAPHTIHSLPPNYTESDQVKGSVYFCLLSFSPLPFWNAWSSLCDTFPRMALLRDAPHPSPKPSFVLQSEKLTMQKTIRESSKDGWKPHSQPSLSSGHHKVSQNCLLITWSVRRVGKCLPPLNVLETFQ